MSSKHKARDLITAPNKFIFYSLIVGLFWINYDVDKKNSEKKKHKY